MLVECRFDAGATVVAEDDPVSRELISSRLVKWGYEVVATQNGTEAIMMLRKKDAPSLAILDWMMPGMDGPEICRRVREVDRSVYIIMLTARAHMEDLVEGLGAGADDYLAKPFDKDELHARILVGLRVMALQTALADRVIVMSKKGTGIAEEIRVDLPRPRSAEALQADARYHDLYRRTWTCMKASTA